MPKKSKMEELNPNYKTAMGSLRYAFRLLRDAEKCLEDEENRKAKKAIQNARHNFRDALKRLNVKESDIESM